MIVTVLWEDSRGQAVRGFAAHDLLLNCLADELAWPVHSPEWQVLRNKVASIPRKGAGNVFKTLKSEASALANSGPLLAVFDRDRVRDLWSPELRPPDCMSGIKARIAAEVPGTFESVFLVQNMESVVGACCVATGGVPPPGKPGPDERDRLISRAAYADECTRAAVRSQVPSFDRVVLRVRRALADAGIGGIGPARLPRGGGKAAGDVPR